MYKLNNSIKAIVFSLSLVAVFSCTDNSSVGSKEFQSDYSHNSEKFGFGSTASKEQIAGWDIDVRPDGLGLPVGSGTVEKGEELFSEKCAMCHGEFGEGVILEQGRASFPVLANSSRSIGAFWPFTSTLFDYINRAMPLFAPQSLKPDEVYSITAFLLNLNEIIEEDFVLTEKNLAKIRLPNEKNFFPKEGNYLKDPRDDDKFKNTKCMSNCIEGEVKVFERIKGISGDYD